ncbi:Serine/threonine-protein kinase pkpA [Astathelohania contejeani]|uniref:Serine/threonine-protein kinase pkpA n=1 Tax=Astathelohania contejeani TaxID=164912 RepID=A0ABQ7I0N2_9MICR|nr:Serine/threonine-protein kinase pkpA [Thelohania contejeani]
MMCKLLKEGINNAEKMPILDKTYHNENIMLPESLENSNDMKDKAENNAHGNINEEIRTYPKYDDLSPIEDFVIDTAKINNRNKKAAKEWKDALLKEDIRNVGELRILVDEDWNKLNLTVFACRAMKNMLYRNNDGPIKEKNRCINKHIIDFDDEMKISEFSKKLTFIIGRSDIRPILETKLISQDIQRIGELKYLHHKDWDKLGLSVFIIRIIRNILSKKGKIIQNGMVL